jgi:hypothetical protein
MQNDLYQLVWTWRSYFLACFKRLNWCNWLCMAVLENVVFEEHTREVDYADKSVTGEWKIMDLNISSDHTQVKKIWCLYCFPLQLLQRTLEHPTLSSTFLMRRYHVLVRTQRMLSFWHVMHLVYSHQWASWTWHRPCIISSVAIPLW